MDKTTKGASMRNAGNNTVAPGRAGGRPDGRPGNLAGLISRRMTIAMAVITVVGGIVFVLGVLFGSRHEFAERGLDASDMTVREYGVGLMVIDTRKAVAFTVLFVACVVVAVAVVGRYYSRKEVAPLERAFRLQKDFVADASHELKTPLAVISTRIDLIEFRHERGQSIDGVLDDLRGDVDRMNAIVTDLLVAARGAVHTEPVALDGVINQSVDAVRPLADKRGVRIETRVDGDPVHFVVQGGAVGLSRCVVAVLDNAIAHAPRDTAVTVTLGYRHHSDVAIRVTDRGPGIGGDPERLFRRFARDDDGTAHQGYGLGLALARDVADRYGGTLDVESTSDAGTTMRLTLPLAR
ncbi:HAMP domain-containing histidine kinase [Bifidobacterium sp. 82T24]|uniref:sensor histidine kinase n=1 Tax=Bifidobacterium pluvialisilvae TaxID=2834436 RepID=UPI001C55EB30|nr:HAMP domain-containing sensor histidine kinase [Bifidobacterium pluvialisilvae]MBW3088441.1 HAMP domain-containing histidine kinase [Bifidobacterium pluvialisilvae]